MLWFDLGITVYTETFSCVTYSKIKKKKQQTKYQHFIIECYKPEMLYREKSQTIIGID